MSEIEEGRGGTVVRSLFLNSKNGHLTTILLQVLWLGVLWPGVLEEEGEEDQDDSDDDAGIYHGAHRVGLPVEEGRVYEERFEGDRARNNKKPKQLAAVMCCGEIGEPVYRGVLKELSDDCLVMIR